MRTFRKERVASVIRDVISNALDHRMQDPRIGPLTTVTRVEVTSDLQIARIFLGVQGDDSTERRTLIAVRHAGGYLRKMVADVITLRMCPELRFEIDRGVKQTRDILKLLDENLRANPSLASPIDDQSEQGEAEAEPDGGEAGDNSDPIEDQNP